MSISQIHKIKRTWTGPARDLIDDGSSGVVPIKPRTHMEKLPFKTANDRLLHEIKVSPNAPFSEIHARAMAEYSADVARAKELDEQEAKDPRRQEQIENYRKYMERLPPEVMTTTGMKRIPRNAEIQLTSGPSGVEIETRPEVIYANSMGLGKSSSSSSSSDVPDYFSRKRTLPSCFTSGFTPEAPKPKWAKTAGELLKERGKLKFREEGGGSSSSTASSAKASGSGSSTISASSGISAGRRSLEADRHVGKLFLSKEQQIVHELAVNEGKSIFFTGSAGTGKSVVLREIIRSLKRKHIHKQDAVAVTASTGIAACNIGGVTLHSFAGVGLGNEPQDALVSKVKRNRKAVSRWLRTQSLIIDEISMIDPDFLEKLEYIGRTIRKSAKPFGGIQIIMTGDFFQLPPVNKTGSQTRYAFDAKCWNDIAQEKINLKQVFRQKDPEFVKILNELRFGKLSQASIAVFSSLTKKSETEESSGLQPTRLFPLRAEVEKANAEQMRDITRPKRTFDAQDGGTLPLEQRDRILTNFMAPKCLHLKPGCQVMLIKNTDESLVNGSIGTVLTFLSPKDWNMAQYSGVDWDRVDPAKESEQEIGELIHQRYSSIDAIKISHDSSYDDGASTRSVSPERKPRFEYLEAMEREAKKERSRSRSASPEKQSEPRKYPVVRFLVPNSKSRTILVLPETWKNEQPDGEIVASRTQIPLILAWAMSIHKSQGQTLPLVKIDLGRVFETGQAYVALSRAVSKEGLQVLNFNVNKVKVDMRVTNWYKSLNTVH